jgi:hypothetical protein
MSNTISALIFQTDGTVERREIEPTLDTFSQIVGGWIEAVSGRGGWMGYLNEEGKLDGLPPNPNGEQFLRTHGWQGSMWDVIVGPLVIVGKPDRHGNDTSLDEHFFQEVLP